MLQNIHDDFIGFVMSAVDATDNLLVGRPLVELMSCTEKKLGDVVKPIKTE